MVDQCTASHTMASTVTSHARLYLLLLLLIFTQPLLFHLGTRTADAADTFDSGRRISDGEKLVSAGGNFTMGFFSLGVPARKYLGIWFSMSEEAVCWVANRNRPINGTSGVLALSDTGRLLLLGGGQVAWSSNGSTGAGASAVAQLLDSGNLVVRDRSSNLLLWQSFDHPSNTLLPGMKAGKNLWTGAEWYITSWRSPIDPSPGPYRRGTETAGLPEIALWRDGVKTYRSGPWNGQYFNGVPEMVSYASMFTFQLTVSPGEITYGYHAKAGAPPSRVIVTDAGMIQRLSWDNNSRAWKTFYSAPRDVCDAYAQCGVFGLCDAGAASTSFCSCVKGFTPVSPSAWYMRDTSGGCRRSVALDCAADGTSAGTTDGFEVVRTVKLPDTHNVTVDVGIGLDECRQRCLSNCSCVAYAASDISGSTGGCRGCIIWSGGIIDIRYMDEGQDLYLRLAKSELDQGVRAKRISVAIIAAICAACTGVAVIICLAFIIWRNIRRRRIVHINVEVAYKEAGKNAAIATSIDLATLEKATGNFSPRNVIGTGGFAVVFEGELPKDHPLLEGLRGRKVAVKKLRRLSSPLPDRVLSDYAREVETVGSLRHDNLVRLLAYCNDGDERILVYEYVDNKSLDRFIFGKPSTRASLSWVKRLEIIKGVCEGVWYLHEGSGEKIVHRDLKPSNVLLDSQFVPKIADFGTLKLFREDQTGTHTVVVSAGYASPEYANDREMTPKCDVFSFGVVLLEIISGLRNSAAPGVISLAWKLWEEHMVLELLDKAVAAPEQHLFSELRKFIHIGLLCVELAPGDRPTISAVRAMLGSKDSLLNKPKGAAQQLGTAVYGAMSLDQEASTEVNLT